MAIVRVLLNTHFLLRLNLYIFIKNIYMKGPLKSCIMGNLLRFVKREPHLQISESHDLFNKLYRPVFVCPVIVLLNDYLKT